MVEFLVLLVPESISDKEKFYNRSPLQSLTPSSRVTFSPYLMSVHEIMAPLRLLKKI